MVARDMPVAEIDVTVDLVRRLLAEQHPDLGGLPLRIVANGWDNVVVRAGDDLAVRMPRRAAAAALVEHEQRWLPELAPRLPLPIPAPVRIGRPGLGYPWSWSVVPWFAGAVAADVPLRDAAREARRLGAFVAALHVEAPSAVPRNPVRAHPVADLDERVAANLDLLSARLDADRSRRRWRELRRAPEWDGPPVWVHGDLHTANLIVADGTLSAVVDFGDIARGDPAVDLAVAWMLFDRVGRAELRRAAGAVDDATWARAQAWALHFALLYLLHSADDPRFARMGTALLAAVLADDAPQVTSSNAGG
jgi:aminoglycoside phosphotransferase (APT) family kinase protein